MKIYFLIVLTAILFAVFTGCVNNPYNDPGTLDVGQQNYTANTVYDKNNRNNRNNANDEVNWANDGAAYNRATIE
ncbi:MAG: hypothetical protein AB9835_14150 [Eubacteriales bacterium]